MKKSQVAIKNPGTIRSNAKNCSALISQLLKVPAEASEKKLYDSVCTLLVASATEILEQSF